jgi:hypothetical protein
MGRLLRNDVGDRCNRDTDSRIAFERGLTEGSDMRPKVTFRKGLHQSQVGEIIPDPSLIGEELAGDDWLPRTVNNFRHLKSLRGVVESSANIRETLARMAVIDDDGKAADARSQCDETTFAALVAARYWRGVATGEGVAEALRADARRAIDDLKPDPGGQPKGLGRELAGEILREWSRRTGEAISTISIKWDEKYRPPYSPVVRFAIEVFVLVFDDEDPREFDEWEPRDRSNIARLLRDAKEKMG